MKKAAFALFLLCPSLTHSMPLRDRLNSWMEAHPTKAAALLIAGTTGTLIAGIKGFQLAQFHYRALSPLSELNKRADACIQAVEASLGEELRINELRLNELGLSEPGRQVENKRGQADLLSGLRAKYQQKCYPLLYCYQMIKMMQGDVRENQDLLQYKLRGHNDLSEMVKTEKIIDRLSVLTHELATLKTFLESTYEYKTELENRRTLELMLASR